MCEFSGNMTKTTLDVLQELRSFRSKLFGIDIDDESSKHELNDILDEFDGDYFEPFAEEYLITGYDIANLNDASREKVVKILIDGKLASLHREDVTYWDRDRLFFCLMLDNEEIFSQSFKLVAEKKPDELSKMNDGLSDSESSSGDGDLETLDTWRDVSLIKIAVLRGLNVALEVMGTLNEEFNLSAINLIYEFGHWHALRQLLEKRKEMSWKPVKLVDFITFLMRAQTFDKDFREAENGKVDFSKCVDLLFRFGVYEINEQNEDQYSPLHLAVMYNKPKTIFHLLKKGAYIGVQDKYDRPAIWNIHSKTLEKYFDQCVEGDDLIVFNFENLIAPSEDYPNDMTAIEFMSNSNDLKYLLEHPLIASFLYIKWNRLALIFHLDFLCYFVLSLIIGCISIHYISDPERHLISMCVITAFFTLFVTLRRTLQVIFNEMSYLRSCENYLNSILTILIVVFLVLFVIAVPLNFHSPTIAAICIILITYEFFILAGTFWHFSIYAEMFIAVTKNAVKSLQLYAIFLPAFSLLFYILLKDKTAQENDGPNLNKFPTLGASVVKTIVMSVGEFDVINVNFDVNQISIYIFIGFVFLISTIFMNLMNGLAVSDTQKIQSKARLTSFKRRSQVLGRYEEILAHSNHWFRDKYPKLWKITRLFTHINTFVYQDKRIYVELDGMHVIYSVKEMPDNIVCMRVPLRSWTRLRSARMSRKIIQSALQVRERCTVDKLRCPDVFNGIEQTDISNRIAKIEDTLKTMEAALQQINDKLNEK